MIKYKNFTILECFSLGKNKDQTLNEDGYFINDNFVAVIDGTTDKSNIKINNKTGGLVAKDLIVESLKKLNGDESPKEILTILIKNLAESTPISIYGNISASIIIANIKRKEVIILGDSKLLIDDLEINNSKQIDDILANKRANIITNLLNKDYKEEDLLKNDLARKEIEKDLIEQKKFENSLSKYGYGVITNNINHLENIFRLMKVIHLNNVKELVLATDGYPILKNTLNESENELTNILNSDPLCFKKFKSTKGFYNNLNSFDDRTYIKIKFDNKG